MGLINDLATLIGAGMSVDDVKALAELEKGKKDEPKTKPEGKKVEKDVEGDETHEEEHVEEKESETSKELESLKKELEESKALIAELQDAERRRNRDGEGSNKTDEELLNDIMLDMY